MTGNNLKLAQVFFAGFFVLASQGLVACKNNLCLHNCNLLLSRPKLVQLSFIPEPGASVSMGILVLIKQAANALRTTCAAMKACCNYSGTSCSPKKFFKININIKSAKHLRQLSDLKPTLMCRN
jgi:hypothetical protein